MHNLFLAHFGREISQCFLADFWENEFWFDTSQQKVVLLEAAILIKVNDSLWNFKELWLHIDNQSKYHLLNK